MIEPIKHADITGGVVVGHDGLLEAAEHADLLVIGSRGAGGFRGLGFGSTADQVVRHTPCPVVLVPVSGTQDPADPDSRLGAT